MENSIQDSILKSGYSITHISKKTNVSRKTIYNIIQGKIPTEKTKNKILQGLTKEVDWLSLKNKGGKVTVEAQYLIDLQNDKIKYLEMELQQLKKIQINNLPLWDDILFDVKTEQVFDDTTCTNFKSYEMKRYQDFYQKLGYTSSEAEKYWRITQKMMINRRGKSTVEQRAMFSDAKEIPKFINFEKTDASVTSVEQVSAHFDYAIKHNITTQLQIYNACYFRKDGSDLLAVLSVLYNFTDMSSTTKIKFIEEYDNAN